jgi:hypothetical protein
MPQFDLVCTETVLNRLEYFGLTAQTLQDAVYLAATGEAASDNIEEGHIEEWCGLIEATQDGVPILPEQRTAVEASVKRRLEVRPFSIANTTPERYVIVSLVPKGSENKEPVYWSAEFGWVRRECAELFDDTSRKGYNLPASGKWESAGEFINARELATILAALRMWQRQGMAEAVAANYQFVQAHPNEPRGNPPETLVATDDFQVPPLSSVAIDDLCDRLNRQP